MSLLLRRLAFLTALLAFCVPGAVLAAGMEEDSELDEDSETVDAEMVYEDEPVDFDGILDFCDDGPTNGEPAVGSLKRVLRGFAVPTDTMNISVPGTVTSSLRLPKAGLPKALRPYANSSLGSARKVARSDGFMDLPMVVNKTGRQALRAAKSDVKLVLSTTQTLPSGQSRTRTQKIVLEH